MRYTAARECGYIEGVQRVNKNEDQTRDLCRTDRELRSNTEEENAFPAALQQQQVQEKYRKLDGRLDNTREDEYTWMGNALTNAHTAQVAYLRQTTNRMGGEFHDIEIDKRYTRMNTALAGAHADHDKSSASTGNAYNIDDDINEHQKSFLLPLAYRAESSNNPNI